MFPTLFVSHNANETNKGQSHLISVEAVSVTDVSFLLKCILTLPCDSHPGRKLVSAVLLLLMTLNRLVAQ